MPWVSSLYPRNDYRGCQLFLCIWTIAGLFFYLVVTIQGLFFIHVATIVCQLVLIVFWTFLPYLSGSQAFVTSLFGPFFRFVNFWFFLIVLWLPSSIVSPQLYFIAFQDFGSLLQSCFWSFITSTMWFLCLLSPSFVLQSWVCCLSLVAFSTFCQRSKQSVLLLLLFAGSFLQLYRPLKVTCLCSTSLSFVVSSFAVWYIQLYRLSCVIGFY